jgi:hypothetical protein
MQERNPDTFAITFLHQGDTPPADVLRLLKPMLALRRMTLKRFLSLREPPRDIFIFDMAGVSDADVLAIAAWRNSLAGILQPVIFIADADMRARLIELGLNRAANLIRRPLIEEDFQSLVRQLSLKRLGPARVEATAAR